MINKIFEEENLENTFKELDLFFKEQKKTEKENIKK